MSQQNFEERFTELCKKYPSIMGAISISSLMEIELEMVIEALPKDEQICCALEFMQGEDEIMSFFKEMREEAESKTPEDKIETPSLADKFAENWAKKHGLT